MKHSQFKYLKLLRVLRIDGKLEITQNVKVARDGKSCSKYEKLPKSCRATCGKPLLFPVSINKTMTKESKQTKIVTFVIVLVVKRAVLNGSTKSRFKKFFLNFSYEEELTVSFNKFLILPGCRSR